MQSKAFTRGPRLRRAKSPDKLVSTQAKGKDETGVHFGYLLLAKIFKSHMGTWYILEYKYSIICSIIKIS